MPALADLMQPYAVNIRVSRLRVINDTFQKALGFQVGGPNIKRSPTGERGAYDVFNETREVPRARFHNAASGVIARQAVGTVQFQIPRSAEKMPLLLRDIANLRPIGGPVDQLDEAGEKYIADQEKIMKQRAVNLREFQCAAMFRGSYGYTQSGDDLTHGFTGTYTVDFRVPSGNKTQLDMLGAGSIIGTSWANAGAPIFTDLLEINKAFIQLTGRGLKHVYVNSVIWNRVVNNTQIQALAGIANPPVKELKRDESSEDFTAILNAIPWVTWHITDNGVNLEGTFTTLLPDTGAVFTVEITPEIAAYYECDEWVVDWVGRPPQPRQGAYFWAKPQDDPARYDLNMVHNGLPVLFIPAAIAFGTVVF